MRFRYGLVLAGAYWLLALPAWAQGDQHVQKSGDAITAAHARAATVAASVDASVLADLLDRIDGLQRRVESLEQQLGAALAAQSGAVTPPAASPIPAALQHTGNEHGVAAAQEVQTVVEQPQYPSLRLHGFADVNFVETDEQGPGGFRMGQLVLHLASALGPKVNVFAEASFAPRSVSAVSSVPINYATDIERAFIRYDHSDVFKLSFGRYHTPTSYWNNAYHHGLFLQTTISRPEMIGFGTAYLPVHFIGVLAEGNLPGSALGLAYSAGVGNGRSSVLTRAGDAGDINDHRAWLGTLRSRPEAVNALEFGVSFYRDRFAAADGLDVDESITGAHVAFTNESPELIAEVVNVRHVVDATGETFSNPGFYVQGGYRLPWQSGRWKPYYRFENINLAAGEPVFDERDYRASTLGVRYEVADFAAFKGEFRRTRQARQPRTNGFYLQTSFTF